MKVTIKNAPQNADVLCGWAAALCTDSTQPDRSLAYAMDSSHFSVLEHANFTFEIEGVSRALLAQLTRHRIASFSVQSQRYVRQDKPGCFAYVTPQRIINLGEWAINAFDHQMQMINSWYKGWQDVLAEAGFNQKEANEDARFVLPNAATTKLAMTMNVRELLHFFSLRCCNCAQWEIRELAWRMLIACKETAPKVFEKAGPGCVRGACPEKRNCGRPYAEIK